MTGASSVLSPPHNAFQEFGPVGQTWQGPLSSLSLEEDQIKAKLLTLNQPCYVVKIQDRLGVTHAGSPVYAGAASNGMAGSAANGAETPLELLATLPPLSPQQLGDPTFLACHGVKYAYMTGAMAGGIASEELVIALGRERILGAFGTGGLPPHRVEAAIQQIQQALPQGPYAFNLLHNPAEPAMEWSAVELYLKHGVHTVEASAFLDLTPSIVYYRVAGLSLNAANQIEIGNRVIAKVSRQEVATKFMQPAPAKILQDLVNRGVISQQQAALAAHVPMADDITVEADSGGHTDNRPLVCLLPAMLALRDRIQSQYSYTTPVRIGAAGGIATPLSALSAFMMGAAYVVTGSINQSCIEAGTSDHTKQLLAQAQMADVMMAPAADMFEIGVKLQVLKKGTMFPLRAQKLYDIYKAYGSIEEIPAAEREKLERQIFHKSLDEVWQGTRQYLTERSPKKLERALNNPKLKMALIFRWYLGLSSRWSNMAEKGREIDYQIWCGPAMGAFNEWAKNTYLAKPQHRKVTDLAFHLMIGSAYLYRIQALKMQGLQLPIAYSQYEPLPLR